MAAAGSHRILAVAMLVDTLGSGLLGPFLLLYGTAVAGLSLPASGVALSVSGGIAILAGPGAGAMVDRVGPFRVAVTANLVSALGCALLLVAREAFVFALAATALAAGTRMFWATFSTL